MSGKRWMESVMLVVVGVGIGLSLSAMGGGVEGGELRGAERVVVGEEGSPRKVVLGRVDGERFGVLVRDESADVEVFVGLRGGEGGERAECRLSAVGGGGERYETVLSAGPGRSVTWARRYGAGGKVTARAGFAVEGEEARLEVTDQGREECDEKSLRWTSRTGELELKGCREFLGWRWPLHRTYGP